MKNCYSFTTLSSLLFLILITFLGCDDSSPSAIQEGDHISEPVSPTPVSPSPTSNDSDNDSDLSFKVRAWTFVDGDRCACCGQSPIVKLEQDTAEFFSGDEEIVYTTRSLDFSGGISPCEVEPVGGDVLVEASMNNGNNFERLGVFAADKEGKDGYVYQASGENAIVKVSAFPRSRNGCELRYFTDDSKRIGTDSPITYTINESNSGETLRVYFECASAGSR